MYLKIHQHQHLYLLIHLLLHQVCNCISNQLVPYYTPHDISLYKVYKDVLDYELQPPIDGSVGRKVANPFAIWAV